MREVLTNMFRRKGRTVLTIFGITIGIFAFTVMGSMAEKINLLVSGGTDYYSDKVVVSGSKTLFLTAPLDIAKKSQIEKVDGVQAVSPYVTTSLDKEAGASFGIPASITGGDTEVEQQYESFRITYSSGRALTNEDIGKVTVGADLVEKLGAKVGGTVSVRDKNYEVVGIMGKTLTAPDNAVVMTLSDAQNIYFDELPELVQSQIRPEQVVNGFTVYTKEGIDPNELAQKIEEEIPDVSAFGPQAFQDQIASFTGIFNLILFGVAFISLVVGGLSVINTMTMSISERTKEIGIKKAVGAKTKNILGEYLTEAGLIGLIGGILGWLLGALVVLSVNNATADSGNQIFLLSTRISVFAIVFATVLGIIAGFYPAYRATRINIVKALREE